MQKYTFISNHQFILTNGRLFLPQCKFSIMWWSHKLLLVFCNAKEVCLQPEPDIA